MKKNLAVRIGAVVMVLMVAFFSILPDLVSAEGDDTDFLAESEIVAEAPEEEVPEVSEEEVRGVSEVDGNTVWPD